MAEKPKGNPGRLGKWREKRRTRAEQRRRVAADKLTHATRGNKDDAVRWGGPMGGG